MLNPIPWYQSPVQIAQVSAAVGAAAALAPRAATALGLTNPTAVTNTVTAVFGVISLGASIWGMIKRKNSPIQPLTFTQAAADAKATPETQAATDAHEAALAAKADSPTKK